MRQIYTINNLLLKNVDTVRDLDLQLDSKMTFSNRIVQQILKVKNKWTLSSETQETSKISKH